jgi:hypothetical protein
VIDLRRWWQEVMSVCAVGGSGSVMVRMAIGFMSRSYFGADIADEVFILEADQGAVRSTSRVSRMDRIEALPAGPTWARRSASTQSGPRSRRSEGGMRKRRGSQRSPRSRSRTNA